MFDAMCWPRQEDVNEGWWVNSNQLTYACYKFEEYNIWACKLHEWQSSIYKWQFVVEIFDTICFWQLFLLLYMMNFKWCSIFIYGLATAWQIKTHGSESWGQEEAAYMHVFWPMWPLQWVIYTDGSSNIWKRCN